MLLHALNFMTEAARCLFNFVYERKTAPQHLRSTTNTIGICFFQKAILPTKEPSPSEMSGNVWQTVRIFYNRKYAYASPDHSFGDFKMQDSTNIRLQL